MNEIPSSSSCLNGDVCVVVCGEPSEDDRFFKGAFLIVYW